MGHLEQKCHVSFERKKKEKKNLKRKEMTGVGSLHCAAPLPPLKSSTGLRRFNPITIVSQNVASNSTTRLDVGIKRREALLQVFLSGLPFSSLFLAGKASAQTDTKESFVPYKDETFKFRIMIPQDWLVGKGETDGVRSVTGFYPQQDSTSNVSVAISNMAPDFTRLQSLGSVDEFAENLVNGLDRSWQRPPGVAAKLIDTKSKNGLYYLEYTLQNPGESKRHIFSVVGLATDVWYNRFYTVTGQFIEGESDNYRSQIEEVVSSFRCG
ncbi:hypothetical protein LUZ60_003392 [Juncus effusus]|nr:hypothetical protein LUZ60_003392 [Juncus effusus]